MMNLLAVDSVVDTCISRGLRYIYEGEIVEEECCDWLLQKGSVCSLSLPS